MWILIVSFDNWSVYTLDTYFLLKDHIVQMHLDSECGIYGNSPVHKWQSIIDVSLIS